MQHDGFLIAIFLIIGLALPGFVFYRVFTTAYTGINTAKSKGEKYRKVSAEEAAAEEDN